MIDDDRRGWRAGAGKRLGQVAPRAKAAFADGSFNDERRPRVTAIVSPDDPARDWVAKREEYARAGIPEYWIIDPRTSQVLVLGLAETAETAGAYRDVADCRPGDIAESDLLEGFSIDVAELFEAAEA